MGRQLGGSFLFVSDDFKTLCGAEGAMRHGQQHFAVAASVRLWTSSRFISRDTVGCRHFLASRLHPPRPPSSSPSSKPRCHCCCRSARGSRSFTARLTLVRLGLFRDKVKSLVLCTVEMYTCTNRLFILTMSNLCLPVVPLI